MKLQLSALTSLGIGFEAGNKPKELYSEEAVNGETQQAHLQAIKELIARDKTTQAW